MGYAFAPQLIGLVRGAPKEGQKHRANGQKVLEEMGNERYSKSVTLDRTRSTLNEYEGFTSGGKCWEAMCEDAAAYRVKVNRKGGDKRTGTEHERPLRSDAVIGWSVIFNPPAEMCEEWDEEDYNEFYQDCFATMQEIEPRLFREENLRMLVKHRDEGVVFENGKIDEHLHAAGDAIDQDGKYCGNLISAALYDRINRDFPRLMRDKGWEMIDDIDRTDYSRMGKNEDGTYKDPEYRAERLAKQQAKRAGRSVNKYVADKTYEALEDAIDFRDDALKSKVAERKAYIEAETLRRNAEKEAAQTVQAAQDKAAQIIQAAEAHRGEIEAEAERKAQANAKKTLQEAAEWRTAAQEAEGRIKTLLHGDGPTAAPDALILDEAKRHKLRDGRTIYDKLAEDAAKRQQWELDQEKERQRQREQIDQATQRAGNVTQGPKTPTGPTYGG